MKKLNIYKEIKDKINSHDYNPEMLLLHLLLRYEELEKERDEAREEAVSFRNYYEEDNLLPWEKNNK